MDFHLQDEPVLDFSTPMLVPLAQYVQDRNREAWRHHRTSPASRAYLYQHAIIWRREVPAIKLRREW